MTAVLRRLVVCLALLLGLALAPAKADASGPWINEAPLPVELDEAGVVAINGLVYVVNGYNTTGPSNFVWAYNPAANNWTLKTPPPVHLSGNATTINGQLYMLGTFGGQLDDTVFVYDPPSDTWAIKTVLPVPQSGGLVAANGRLYVIGGIDAVGVFNNPRTARVQEYDPAAAVWTTKAPMLQPTGDHIPVEINGRIYVAGGDSSGGAGVLPYQTLQIFDPVANSWVFGAPIPTPRSSYAAANVNGRLHVLGGSSGNSFGAPPSVPPGSNCYFSSFGGGVFGCVESVHEEYDPTTNVWTSDPDLPVATSGAGSAGDSGVLYVAGGIVLSGNNQVSSAAMIAMQAGLPSDLDALAAAGPAGPKGDPGPQGPKGDTGAQGDSGLTSLLLQSPVAVGDVGCPFGGISVSSGLDSNRNGVLDAAEIASTTLVCNGATGATGAQGPKGDTGATGQQGPVGPQGEGLFSGSLLLLPAGAPAPSGYTFVGHFTLSSTAAGKKGDFDVDMYRKN